MREVLESDLIAWEDIELAGIQWDAPTGQIGSGLGIERLRSRGKLADLA